MYLWPSAFPFTKSTYLQAKMLKFNLQNTKHQMDTIWLILAFLLALGGIAGSFLPVIPGPPVAFAGLAILKLSEAYAPDDHLLGAHLLAALAITLLDYYVPIAGTKKMGGSTSASRGAAIGLVLGLFAGPLGIVIGPFIGALLAEMIVGRPVPLALKAAIGAFLGFLTGVIMKFAYACVVIFHIFQQI
jgi:uncharacterized protein